MENTWRAFQIPDDDYTVQPIGSGLINHTWKISGQRNSFIGQRINTAIFKDPEAIAHNIRVMGDFFEQYNPRYCFTQPVPLRTGGDLLYSAEGVFRMFPFIEGSYTIDTVQSVEEAREAAYQFGFFAQQLSDLDADELKITLPDFHNLDLRYRQFEEALQQGDPQRIAASQVWIDKLQSLKYIRDRYLTILSDPEFKLRPTHHDTKISNVLFYKEGKGLCVIDLDTVMPGYFISDLGDMMRTYLSPVSEEEADYSKISIRTDVHDAVLAGYLHHMEKVLTAKEKAAIPYAGQFMIYMQALRFLTDHLNSDRYYGAKYEGHNLVRAGNQITLLELLITNF
jgi:Ser/Thr protein kinase RdoA (MazF antagonist)